MKKILSFIFSAGAISTVAIMGVVALFALFLSAVDFSNDRLAVRREVDKDVHRLGQKLAVQNLILVLPYMEKSERPDIVPRMAEWGELHYRARKIYDETRPWGEKEYPFEVLRMISQEYAFGIFHKKHPERSCVSAGEAYKEARLDPEWTWSIQGEELLNYLDRCGSEALNADSRKKLSEIRQCVELGKKKLEKFLEDGPPPKKAPAPIIPPPKKGDRQT
jgi:hypothetical protein